MPPKKNAGASKTSKGKSSEDSGAKVEKKGGSSVKVRTVLTLSVLRFFIRFSLKILPLLHLSLRFSF